MLSYHKYLVLGLLIVMPGMSEAALVPSARPNAIFSIDDPTSGPVVPFTVADGIQVPGKKLGAGDYTIRVVDHLSDRMIVRVERKGKLQSIFLALPKSNLTPASAKGPIVLGAGSKSAMRGFVFPDGTVAEFVFPKGEAVGLAKANGTTIPAIDPASEGRPASGNLSNDDMQMVTLWMLSPKPVSGNDSGPGIEAAKYQVPRQVAGGEAPTPVKPRPKPVMAALPHTASQLPAIELAGLLSLVGASFLMRRRV